MTRIIHTPIPGQNGKKSVFKVFLLFGLNYLVIVRQSSNSQIIRIVGSFNIFVCISSSDERLPSVSLLCLSKLQKGGVFDTREATVQVISNIIL